MAKADSLKLYEYHVWANVKVFQHLKELPTELYHQEVQSVFPSLYDALAHIYIVDNVWLQAISGKSFDETVAAMPAFMEEVKGKNLVEIEELYFQLSERFSSFFAEKEDFDAVSTYTHPALGMLKAPCSEIIQHIVNHGTYHRGNITAMLRQMGHKGVSSDYIYYLYEVNQ